MNPLAGSPGRVEYEDNLDGTFDVLTKSHLPNGDVIEETWKGVPAEVFREAKFAGWDAFANRLNRELWAEMGGPDDIVTLHRP